MADDLKKMRDWVETWKQYGPVLDELRDEELRRIDDEEEARKNGRPPLPPMLLREIEERVANASRD